MHTLVKRTILQHKINTKKVKPGLVASYDIWPGNGTSPPKQNFLVTAADLLHPYGFPVANLITAMY